MLHAGRALWMGVLLLALGCQSAGTPSAPPPAKPAATTPVAAAASPGAGATTPASAAAVPERLSIKYGYNPILPGTPVFVAQERGYFAEQGVDVDYSSFDSAALMVAPVAAGQLDVIPAVPSPSFFNALAREITMKAVAGQSLSGTALLVRKELIDSGQVRTLADLKGKRVSFNVEGSPVDYTLRVALQKNGMSLQDVDVQRVVNTDLAAALANSAVDAGVVPEPLPTLIESRGFGVRFLNVQDLAGRQEASFVAIGPSMLSRPDAATVRFLTAYLRGVRDYVAAIENQHITDPQVVEITSKWTNIPAEIIRQAVTYGVDPNGRLDLDDVNRQQDFWEREGLVPTKVDLTKVIDYHYLDAALAQLR